MIQLIRQRPAGVPAASVLVADHDAIRDAVFHLAGLGRRRIAYIGGAPALSSGRERLAAFLAGMDQAGLDADADLIRTGAPTFHAGRQTAAEIIDLNRADALVCGGFEISNGALGTFMDRGLSPHGPVHFVGYGNPSFYRWIAGGVSTIGVPVESLAREALDILGKWQKGAVAALAAKSFNAELIARDEPA